MIWLDEPRWAAHGTLFGHLVSDTSLWELHDFAESIGLDVDAFDHDHYDLPLSLRDLALDRGAQQTGERDLVARLVRSGLRVRADQRRPHPRNAELLAQWPLGSDLGGRVLACWREPHRGYHDASHLAEVLCRLNVLADQVPRPVLLAAWFHDAVYRGRPTEDEHNSAALADACLDGLIPGAERSEVIRLVRLTINHDPSPADEYGKLLCDADLGILAAAPGRYHVSLRDIRREYARLSRSDFLAGRLSVVERLAEGQVYRGDRAVEMWSSSATWNLADEKARLLAGMWLPDPR